VFSSKTFKNSLISLFVVLWLCVYHYMSLKQFYLEPWLKRPLPRVPMLFPPAGWIMFYQVDDQFGEVNVYGLEGAKLVGRGRQVSLNYTDKYLIDQHEIFRTRTILFDNIKRGLIHGAVARQQSFCAFLEYRFPHYDGFEIRYIYYPEMTKTPHKRFERVGYQCVSKGLLENELR
jgi:hypothetical protein